MKITEDINAQIIACYKSGESEKRIFLQTVKSLLLNEQKEKQEILTDEEEIGVLQGELKKLQEAMGQYKAGGRDDLVEKSAVEIAILREYLPEEMDEAQIRTTVEKIISDAPDKSFGNIMGMVMAELKGRADGSKVAQIVRELLQEK